MNAMAHDSTLSSIERVINLWPEDPAEDAEEMGLRQRAVLFSATGVALAGLFTAILLQTAYHAVVLLWVSLGLPLLFATKAIAHMGRAAVDRIRALSDPRPPHRDEASREEVRLTFDELALIYKSLEAVKTLGALPPQDELLEDTIEIVDQSTSRRRRRSVLRLPDWHPVSHRAHRRRGLPPTPRGRTETLGQRDAIAARPNPEQWSNSESG